MRSFSPPFLAICLALLASYGNSVAQQDAFSYARWVVDTLSSPYMAGRGYVNDGDLKAARFIASQLKEMGLRNYQNNYFQNFATSVNTFPGAVAVAVNGKQLRPGEDFIIDPCSPSVEGVFKTFSLPSRLLTGRNVEKLEKRIGKRGQNKILVIDESRFSKSKREDLAITIRRIKNQRTDLAGIVVLTEQKLIWSVSPIQCGVPLVRIKKSAVAKKIKTAEIIIESRFIERHSTQNVIGYIPGKKHPDSLIVFTAHYDHLGLMGDEALFPGANDNASGVAMLLSLARSFTQQERHPDYTLVFIAFAAEELYLRGSKHFVERPFFPLENIRLLINTDIAGTGDEGITVVNGTIHTHYFNILKQLNDENNLLPEVRERGEACNSDHCYFHELGVPSFFIYTRGGIQAYHDIYDRRETLPLTEFSDYLELLRLFTWELMN